MCLYIYIQKRAGIIHPIANTPFSNVYSSCTMSYIIMALERKHDVCRVLYMHLFFVAMAVADLMG